MLEVRDLHYTYPGWPPTLRGASLHVDAGRSGFLLGPSGSGKSTLLRCIAGLERPQAGTVMVGGRDVGDVPTHRRGVGLLFQEPALFPNLNVWRNVAFGLRYADESPPRFSWRLPWGVAARQERADAEHWLAVAGLAGKAESRVDELSGGERQRVALARTLAARPRVVLLDEPFSNLDRALRDELGPRVKQVLAEQGVAALWVTHDEDEAFRLGDSVWRLVAGQAASAHRPSRPAGSPET